MDKILEVRGLSKVFGKGCPKCFESTGPRVRYQYLPALRFGGSGA